MDFQSTYKFKKGDKLEKIAKAWGHSKPAQIWDDPLNKALKSKRKSFDKLEAGDKIIIPYTPKQKKQIIEKTLHYMDLIEGERLLGQELLKRAEFYSTTASTATATGKAAIEDRKALEKGLRAQAKIAKDTMFAVDVTAEVLLVLVKVGGKGKQASKLSGDALKKVNKEALQVITGIPGAKLKSAAEKASLNYLMKQDNVIGQAAGALYALEESWGNLTSPGFWAKTLAAFDEGKSWSESVNFDIDQDITNQLAKADKTFIPSIKKTLLKAQEATKLVKENQRMAKHTLDRIKIYEKQKAALPVVT